MTELQIFLRFIDFRIGATYQPICEKANEEISSNLFFVNRQTFSTLSRKWQLHIIYNFYFLILFSSSAVFAMVNFEKENL